MMVLIAGLATATLLILYSFALGLPDIVNAATAQGILFALIFCAGVLVAHVASGAVTLAVKATGRHVSELVALSLSVVFFLPILAADLHFVLRADLAALLTTSALATAIAGFALQATLGNFFEGLAIQINRPFRIGDAVVFGTVKGKVENLSWRAIRIRDAEGRANVVPNSALAKEPIKVITDGDRLRVAARFSVATGVEPGRVRAIVEGAVATIDDALATPPALCRIGGFSPFPATVNYIAEVSVAAKGVDPDIMESRLNERIWYALSRAGIALGGNAGVAFPVRAEIEPAPPDESEAALRALPGETALAGKSALAGVSATTRSRLLESAGARRYARGERLVSEEARIGAAFVIVAGRVDLAFDTSLPVTEPTVPRLWPRESLEPLIDRFVQSIGPAGRQIVTQAAPHATDLGVLYDRLALRIPDDAARTAFLAARPQNSVVELGPGQTLNFATLLADIHLPRADAICRSETTVLTFDGDALRAALRGSPRDVEAMAKLVAAECESHGRTSTPNVVAELIRRSVAA